MKFDNKNSQSFSKSTFQIDNYVRNIETGHKSTGEIQGDDKTNQEMDNNRMAAGCAFLIIGVMIVIPLLIALVYFIGDAISGGSSYRAEKFYAHAMQFGIVAVSFVFVGFVLYIGKDSKR